MSTNTPVPQHVAATPQADTKPAGKPRIALFDNIKGIAIILVVLGHFVTNASGATGSHFITTALTIIYFFHMPLFLFCSGLFAGKAWYKRHEAPTDKALLYLLLYLIFITLIVALYLFVFHKTPHPNPFVVDSARWFMLVLTLYMLMVPVMGSFRPALFLVVAIALAVASGIYLPDAKVLSLGRFFVYLPYFALGFYLQPNRILDFVNWFDSRIGEMRRILLAAIIAIAAFTFLYVCFADPQLLAIKRLSTGLNLLDVLADRWHVELWILMALRVVEYPLVALAIGVAILLCPKDKSFLTIMGERSFQVYIMHILIYYCMKHWHFYGGIISDPLLIIVSPFVLAPLLTALLAWPKVPNDLVQALAKWCKKAAAPK